MTALSRRSILAGALASPFASLPAANAAPLTRAEIACKIQAPAGARAAPFADLPALAAPRSQAEIAREVHALAARLSHLLAELDGGNWRVTASAPFKGAPIFDIRPANPSPKARLHVGMSNTRAALADLRPGRWRSHCDLDGGLVLFVEESWRDQAEAQGSC